MPRCGTNGGSGPQSPSDSATAPGMRSSRCSATNSFYEAALVEEATRANGASLSPALRGCARYRCHRARRRAFQGRDGQASQSGQDRAHSGPRRRLLAGRLDHRRERSADSAALSGRASRDLRQHFSRVEANAVIMGIEALGVSGLADKVHSRASPISSGSGTVASKISR